MTTAVSTGDRLVLSAAGDRRPGAPPLLAVAHGSRDPRAAATVEALLNRVRARRPELSVEAAYLDHSPPTVERALSDAARAGADEVVVLPLLLTAAYHSKTDVPRALAEVRRRHPRMRLRYGAPLGPHPSLVAAMERRLAESGPPPGDPDTAVVLVGAGSSDAGANATVARIARQWRSRGWWAAVPAYASAETPAPAEAVSGLRAAGAPRVAVAPYFLAPGHFADAVHRASLRAGADAVAEVLGSAPDVAEVVAQRYDEAIEAHREPARPATVG